jgi:hypothetical protein
VCRIGILVEAENIPILTYIHTTHALAPKGYQRYLRNPSEVLSKLVSYEEHRRRDNVEAIRITA